MDGFGAIHHGWDNFKKYKKSYPVLGERDEKDKKSEEEEGKEAHRGGDQRAEGKADSSMADQSMPGSFGKPPDIFWSLAECPQSQGGLERGTQVQGRRVEEVDAGTHGRQSA